MLTIQKGKLVDENGNVIRPDLSNAEHIKVINSAKKRVVKPKICYMCGSEMYSGAIKVEPAPLKYRVKNGKFYDQNNNQVPIILGDPDQIKALKKQKVKYICTYCNSKKNLITWQINN